MISSRAGKDFRQRKWLIELRFAKRSRRRACPTASHGKYIESRRAGGGGQRVHATLTVRAQWHRVRVVDAWRWSPRSKKLWVMCWQTRLSRHPDAQVAVDLPSDPAAVGAGAQRVVGAIGRSAFASMTLTVEKVRIIRSMPSCNVNPIVSCGSVMTHRRRRCWAFPTRRFGIVLHRGGVTGVLEVRKCRCPGGIGSGSWLVCPWLADIPEPVPVPCAHTAWWSRSSPHCWRWSRPHRFRSDAGNRVARAQVGAMAHRRWSLATLRFTTVFLPGSWSA